MHARRVGHRAHMLALRAGHAFRKIQFGDGGGGIGDQPFLEGGIDPGARNEPGAVERTRLACEVQKAKGK